MSKFYETKEFKKLNKEWKTRLNDSGFHDIEEDDHSIRTDTAHFTDMAAVQEYYILVGEYLHTGSFPSPIEKTIWFIYGEGYSVREVCRIMKRSRGYVEKVLKTHIRQMRNGRE